MSAKGAERRGKGGIAGTVLILREEGMQLSRLSSWTAIFAGGLYPGLQCAKLSAQEEDGCFVVEAFLGVSLAAS